MQKPFKYNELSNTHCIVCGKPIKKNVLIRKPNTNKCYLHGRPLNCHTAREARNNPSLKRKQLRIGA